MPFRLEVAKMNIKSLVTFKLYCTSLYIVKRFFADKFFL